ncbi:hypothetical protein HMPREF9134_00910 [Porphyromonas catoniae F0037]|uniref:Uncharacterized protein n=1 Tax=Porphyromonas catoniae F0037 TaxID=1127696 RepID=L1NDT3_9PORP|nr:hypothetical protein HMPREF9134_00910 [Porphyromonas catoniae F0037]
MRLTFSHDQYKDNHSMALGFCGIPWCGEALFGSGVLLRILIKGCGSLL